MTPALALALQVAGVLADLALGVVTLACALLMIERGFAASAARGERHHLTAAWLTAAPIGACGVRLIMLAAAR